MKFFAKPSGLAHLSLFHHSYKQLKFSGDVKLCDFGESRLSENSYASTRAGTINYWPPEHFQNSPIKYDVRPDLWSLGITLFEVILGRLPYVMSENDEITAHIVIPKANLEIVIEENVRKLGYSEDLCEILSLLCARQVENRPKLQELQTSNFYKTFENVEKERISDIIISFSCN